MSPNTVVEEMNVQEHESGFSHVVNAMQINFVRGISYCRMTGGRSLLITIPLIMFEAMTGIVLGFYDIWGKWFNREGISIIQGDYMPMSIAKPMDAPLRFTGQAPKVAFQDINKAVRRYQREAISATLSGDFHGVAVRTKELILGIMSIEDETESLFPMHRHLLESIGFAAVNGITYHKQSEGRTSLLSKCFILTQVMGLNLYCPFDSLAQVCHGYGAGILENDVPYIPFLERFEG